MPVFFHKQTHEIEDYCMSRQMEVALIAVDGTAARIVSANGITAYLEATWLYYGAYPQDYIVIGNRGDLATMDARSTIGAILAGRSEAIAVLGYNDGGVFSISATRLPFQEGAEERPNWAYN